MGGCAPKLMLFFGAFFVVMYTCPQQLFLCEIGDQPGIAIDI